MISLMRDILTTLPGAGSKELHQVSRAVIRQDFIFIISFLFLCLSHPHAPLQCIQYFTATALDQYLANAEEEVMDSDLSYEFHRESHHIHSIPRPRISQVITVMMMIIVMIMMVMMMKIRT